MPNATLSARRYAFGGGLTWATVKLLVGWVVVLIVLAAVLPAIVSQFRSIEISAWYHVANAGKVVAAIIGGSFLYTLLPIMVAQGMTRRELSVSMGVFGLLWSAVFGTVAAAGLLAEHAYYNVQDDWTHGILSGTNEEFSSFADVAGTAVTFPLLYLVYFAAGTLVGIATYRWDGGWLIAAPLVPIALALDAGIARDEPWGPGWLQWATDLGGETNLVIAALTAVAAIGLSAWLTRLILVNTPLRAKKT